MNKPSLPIPGGDTVDEVTLLPVELDDVGIHVQGRVVDRTQVQPVTHVDIVLELCRGRGGVVIDRVILLSQIQMIEREWWIRGLWILEQEDEIGLLVAGVLFHPYPRKVHCWKWYCC